MARALVVRRGETVDAYHLLSTVGQVASSSASHCSEPYDGDIDEVRVYRRAFTAQEVASLYASERP